MPHLPQETGLTPALICTGTGLTPALICTGTGLTPVHICTGTGLTPPTSAPGHCDEAGPRRVCLPPSAQRYREYP